MIKAGVRKLAVFVNEASGFDSKAEDPEKLRQRFGSAGWDVTVRPATKGDDIAAMAREAQREGYPIVAGAGGDGTLRAVAAALAGSDTAFGVLPAGTLNHFARDLNIPLDLEAAADVVASGEAARVDIGEVNGAVFLNNAILGLYPWYRAIRDGQERRGRLKPLAILTALWRVFRINPAHEVQLIAEGKRIVRRTPYILVANNRHAMEGYHLGARESLTEGKLYVYLMKPQSRLGLLWLLFRLLAGRFRTGRDFAVFATEEVLVGTRRKKVDVSLDGEIVTMSSPLVFRSRPLALNVIVPRRG